MRTRRVVTGIVVSIIALVATALLLVVVVTDTDWGREQVRVRVLSALRSTVHGTMSVKRVSGNLLRGITLHDVRIADSTGRPFVSAKAIRTGYALRGLLSKRIELSDMLLDSADIVLERDDEGGWNYERIFPSDTTTPTDTAFGFGDWIVLRDVRVARSRLRVITPWHPDTTLQGAARDSAVRAALAGDTRVAVSRRGDRSLQQTQDFRDIAGVLSLVRLAHPQFSTRLVRADTLRMEAFAFAPPGASVRALHGDFELNGDSLWFNGVQVRLPSSRAELGGRYEFSRGDLALVANATPVALSDVRFLYPALPDSGIVRGALQLVWEGGAQRYDVRALDLVVGSTRVAGDVALSLNDSGNVSALSASGLHLDSLPTELIERMVPGLALPARGVLDGEVTATGVLDSLELDADIVFDEVRSGRSRVSARGQLGLVDGAVRTRDLRVGVAPLQVPLLRLVSPTLPLRGTLTGGATVNGRSDTRLHVTDMDLAHLDRGALSRVSGRVSVAGMQRFASMVVDASITARPLSLVTVGRFAPAAELRGNVSGPIAVVGPMSALAIQARLASSDGGRLEALGTLDLASRDLGYALDLRSSFLDMHQLSAKAPRTSLSAFVQTRARGTTPNTVRGTFAMDAAASSVDTVAVDSLRVRAQVQNGVLDLRELWVRAPGTLVLAQGGFGIGSGAKGRLDWSARVDSLPALARYLPPSDTGSVPPRPLDSAERLARARRDSAAEAQRLAVARMAGEVPPAAIVRVDSASTLPRDSLAGSLAARGTISGGLDAFDLTGVLDGLGLVARGSALKRAHAEFEWRGALTSAPRIGVRFSGDSLLAAGFALDSLTAFVQHAKPGGTAELSVYQNESRDYGMRASYAIYPDRREVTWNRLRLRFDSTVWQAAHDGRVRWGQPGFFIDSLDLRHGNTGRIFAHGLVPNEGAADLRLLVRDFQLGDLLGLAQSDLEGRGRIGLEAHVTGSGRAPRIAGTLQLQDAQYRDTRVPTVASQFDYADKILVARATLTDSGRPATRPVAIADARLPVDLAFFDVTGSRLIDAPASGKLVADSLPLDLLSRITTALQQVRGSASGTATLQGTLKDPSMSGRLTVRDAQARVAALGITLRSVNGTAQLSGDTVRLDSLVGWSDGRVAVRGSASIAEARNPSVNMQLDIQRARVIDNEQGRVRADVAITARGPFDGILVEGRTHIRDGVIYIPESDNREVISSGDPALFAVIDTSDVRTRELVPAQSPLLANLRTDIALAVDRDTWVRSRDANIEIYSDGDLRIQVDRRRSALTLDGILNTDRGEYQLLGKRFQVKRGAVQFIGTQEINPLLQITGEYEVKQATRPSINIGILIGGTLRSPRLTLESDAQPPISQTDLLSYLAFGSQSGSLMQFGSSSLSGGSTGGNLVGTSAALATRQLTGVALGVAVEELEGQAARSLGADVLNITPANVPPELASGNFGALSTFLRGTQFEFGKYVNTRTFVGLQLQATTTPGFRLERQLGRTPGLSLESTFQPRFFLPEPSLSEQEITKANAFGLFIRKRWRF